MEKKARNFADVFGKRWGRWHERRPPKSCEN